MTVVNQSSTFISCHGALSHIIVMIDVRRRSKDFPVTFRLCQGGRLEAGQQDARL
jgi:hypothetical protein